MRRRRRSHWLLESGSPMMSLDIGLGYDLCHILGADQHFLGTFFTSIYWLLFWDCVTLNLLSWCCKTYTLTLGLLKYVPYSDTRLGNYCMSLYFRVRLLHASANLFVLM